MMAWKPPQKARRDANEPEIIAELQAWGLSVYRLDKPCDLLCGIYGKTRIAEVKVEGAKLTEAQVKFSESWRGNWDVLRSVEDAADFAREMRGENSA